MEKKGNRMAGIEVLKIDEIRLDEPRIKKDHNEDFLHKQRIFIKKYGQYVVPMVAKVEGIYRVIDGLGFVKNYKSTGKESIHCNFMGEMTVEEFITFRLFYNIKRTKLDHLVIAEVISSYFKTKQDFRRLSHRTNITQDDIEKYSKLLEFDWEEFARKPLVSQGLEQMTFFDMFDNEEIF